MRFELHRGHVKSRRKARLLNLNFKSQVGHLIFDFVCRNLQPEAVAVGLLL
jgi:hypothetical protein